MDRVQLKNLAKSQLGGNILANTWLTSVVVALVAGAIAGISSIISIIFVGIISVGVTEYHKYIARNSTPHIESALHGVTHDVGGTIVLGFVYTLFIALWSLLFAIPGIVKSYSYSMAFYLKSENETWDWKMCIDESRRIMDGHKLELFILDLSFVGWYIVGALCFGIGTLWVNAYHSQTRINYFEQLTKLI